MADLSIYELEDIWDDFERSGDHIVPHKTEDHVSEDKCKKPRLDLTPLQSNETNAFGSHSQFKDEKESKTLNKETEMMEKDSWSHITDNMLTASGDANSARDVFSVQSGDNITKLSKDSLKSSNINSVCTVEEMLKDTSGVVDRNSYNDCNLFSNDCDDKEASDLLYFGWPDIGNFEDVDRILSNCNTSFGLGIAGSEDDMVWLRSEDPGGGYEETLKTTDLKFPSSEQSGLTNVTRNHEPKESDDKVSRYVSERNGINLINRSGHDSVGYMQSTAYSGSNLVPSQKQFQMSNKTECRNEISHEEATFRQLHQATLQLDVRTKLCIRDSLYRLARSAEQRHNCGGTSGPLMTEGTSKYTGFMNIETDTNPIDRTIAHLLFHRPSDSSNMPTPSPVKQNRKEQSSCQQTEDESDDKISRTRKN